MCGRYVLSAEPQLVQQEFNLSNTPQLAARYNIAPSQPVAIITNQVPDELMIVKWGLVPSWSKDPKIGYKMINSRSETAHEKPSFRAAFKRRRCLIPVSGFYEWTKTDDGKQPHYIHVKDSEVFSFAGLWEIWHSPDGDEMWTATILTTEANEAIEHLHHRMPVILDGENRDIWLDGDSDVGELRLLMKPYAGDKMAHYPVSKAVNSVRNDNPTLIERDDPPTQQSMF
ncbi:MAG: SOS response-associated peptidase [Anaerolineae bacterium]|nr:SOS response-associated peptidase [Anaerolineae bacterium]MDQ7035692.1 SOS response-associated peptidase [Anaerolineae bacterium]